VDLTPFTVHPMPVLPPGDSAPANPRSR